MKLSEQIANLSTSIKRIQSAGSSASSLHAFDGYVGGMIDLSTNGQSTTNGYQQTTSPLPPPPHTPPMRTSPPHHHQQQQQQQRPNLRVVIPPAAAAHDVMGVSHRPAAATVSVVDSDEEVTPAAADTHLAPSTCL